MANERGKPWPAGEAAVSLTFDDGLKTQFERAIPYMNKVGLRGTFYLNPRDDYRERLAPWAEAAAAGHELGNHTCTHPCSRSLFGTAKGLETMTLGELEADVLTAQRRLDELFPKQKERSFCYPCYNHHVGEGPTRQSYVPIVAKHFLAARGGTTNPGFPVEPTYCDLHYLEAQQCEYMKGYELIGLCERAANRGHWCLLVFHGIQEGHLNVADGDFRELCDHLARHKDRFHVAPVIEIAKRILATRK
jgi:hypothetical protein